ncbi:E3 ubiquitin-protein ligase RNF182-like [Scleropages formosus]|uniref:E3 ubiquitin-protein ligase RNF182 n=1 Tax=Scleropages formosus TaxID=113540 RepID=A0A8C9S091_SCLFO|nr:E3 ubiquitin-protein ligase RNF182-like [Scleropages formosus]
MMLEDEANELSLEALECKICFCLYTLGGRRPKVLDCCHRLCAKCLTKIMDLTDIQTEVVICPFCRYPTTLPQSVGSIPDDCNIMTALRYNRRNHGESTVADELLLSPKHLSSFVNSSSSSCRDSRYVVMTMTETAQELSNLYDTTPIPSSSSHDYLTSICWFWPTLNCATVICQTSARVLVWLFGLLYISSLPLGVYLLIVQRKMLGVLLISLVPSSMMMFMIYSLCQCLCQKFWDCISM